MADTLVIDDSTQTLSNKTLTSPVINTAISGTAVKDEDDMASDSATAVATQQSIKAYADNSALPTGWIDAKESWSYSAWDDTNGVSTATITVPSDATTKYQAGMRVKFTQPTDGAKYGIITKVAATALTVFMNTDYDFDNEAITSPFYSPMTTPFGFDADIDKYTVEKKDTSLQSQVSPTADTWYNLGSISIDIPVGCWRVYYQVAAMADLDPVTTLSILATLSTANNSESDAEWTVRHLLQDDTSDRHLIYTTFFRENSLLLSTKDTYYLNASSNYNVDWIRFGGNSSPTIIRAICAYL